jgi:hypothetical protein
VEERESQEALNTFFSGKLEAAAQAAGITIQPQVFEIFNEIKCGSRRVRDLNAAPALMPELLDLCLDSADHSYATD